MKSVRDAIRKSWFPEMKILRPDLARSLQLTTPLSLTELTRHLDKPEERSFKAPVDADALHGEAEFVMRSDGTYTFRGHLRATGAPSFAYKLQATIHSAANLVIVVEAAGRVFGSDTPGDRESSWDESNISTDISRFWTDLRSNAQFATNLEKNISGVLGALEDVAETVIETYVAAQFRGIVGAVIVLGVNLGFASGQSFINPNILVGITVGAGILLVFGPAAIIPAVAAGTGAALLAGIRSRPMNDGEIRLAQAVFGDKLPDKRILITDLYTPSSNENGPVAREFTIPVTDGSILVNMGKNFEHTLESDVQRTVRGGYETPGEVLIHELTHAWQINFSTFLPGLLCKALTNKNYKFDQAKVDRRDPWSSFGPEEQATIVNQWFAENVAAGLNSNQALNNDKFFYISKNIHTGATI